MGSQAFAQFQYKQKLVAPDRAFGDNFGIYSTDIEDSLMITGSFWNDLDENGINVLSNAGAAYIYSLNNTGNWTFHQKLVSNPRNIDDNFGRTVLLYNDFAFVASTNAYFDTLGNDSTPGAGLVFVFKKNTLGNYVQTQILQGVHRNKSALFGFSLEAHNNYLYVGSVGDSADATNSTFAVSAGSVNIFNYNLSSGRWEFQEKMVAYDRDGSDQFGYNIKVYDNTLVIAATTDEHDSAGTFIGGGVGSIYIYRNDGGNWVWEDKISTNDGSSNDRLGESIGLSDGYIAASATGVDTDSSGANPITNNGAVYTFKRSPSGNWFQTDKVTEPIRQNGDFFGYHISLDGETLISSAYNEDEDENGINTISAAGALYVYKRQSNENWKFSQKIVEPNRQIADQMGRGLAYHNGYLLASAPGEKLDENELNSLSAAGAVFVFYDSTLAPQPPIIPTYPISTLKSVDTNGEPDSINVYCKVEGIVTTIDFDGDNGYSFFIQDSTAGIYIFGFNDVSNYSLTTGDRIKAIGKVGFFNGATQISVDSIVLISQNNALPAPKVVNAFTEADESILIKLNHVKLADPSQWPTFKTSKNLDLVTPLGDTLVMRIDSDTDISDSLFIDSNDIFSVTGVLTQFDNSSPYFEGYQIWPSSANDFSINNSDTLLYLDENSTNDTIFDLSLIVGNSSYNYSISSGDSSNNFEIQGDFLLTSSNANLDAEINSNYTLEIDYNNTLDSGSIIIEISINDLVEYLSFGFQSGYSLNGRRINETKSNLPLGSSPRSIQAWFKKGVNALNPQAIVNYGTWNSNEIAWLGIINSGYVGFANNYINSVRVDDNVWHHTVATYDGTNLKLYLDGILYINTPVSLNTIGTDFTIGANIAGGFEIFQGDVDEIAIWDRVLTEEEVIELGYRSPSLNNNGLKVYYDFNLFQDLNNNYQTQERISGVFETIGGGSDFIVQGPGGVSNPFSLEFNKSLSIGDKIGQVNSIDIDGNSITYNFISGGNGAFDINPSTGEIFVTNLDSLNGLSNSAYLFSIGATESGDNTADTMEILSYLRLYLGPVSLPYSQSFETPGVGYLNQTGDKGNWSVKSLYNEYYTGPSVDYDGNSFAILQENSQEDSAILELPYFDVSSESGLYMHFKYHSNSTYTGISEEDLAKLMVRIDTNNSSNWITVFDTSGVFGDIWNSANIDLREFDGASLLRVQFIQTHGYGYYSQIALDDIHVSGATQEDLYIDKLINTNCYSNDSIELKGIVKVRSSNAVVNLISKLYSNNQEIASFAQPFFPQPGNDILEVNFGKFPKSTSQIFNMSISVTGGNDTNSYNDTANFKFEFTTPGLANSESIGDSIKLFYQDLNPDYFWFAKLVGPGLDTLKPIDVAGFVEFTGLDNNTFYTITLQEICNNDTLYGGVTSTISSACDSLNFPFEESFEQTICFDLSNENYKWQINSGPTSSINTGPSLAQKGNYYAYTEASSGNAGNEANLTLSPFNLPINNNIDLTFFHHMYGGDIGSLYVLIDTANQNNWDTLFFDSGEKGNFWIFNQISLANYSGAEDVRIRFTGIRGANIAGDIAIDNIQVKERNSYDFAAIRLAEGSCSADSLTPFQLEIKNIGLDTITNYTARVYLADSTLLGQTSDSLLSIAPDSSILVPFNFNYTKINNQNYFASISSDLDTNSANNFATYTFTSNSSDFSIVSSEGSVELTLQYNIPTLFNHHFISSLSDSNAIQIDSIENEIAYLGNLNQLTTYNISISEVCGQDTFFLKQESVTTSCSSQPIPFFQSFENANECYEASSFQTSNYYFIRSTSSFYGPATDGNYFLYARGFAGDEGDTALIELPFLDLTLEPNPKLYFDFKLSSNFADTFSIWADTNGSENWIKLAERSGTTLGNWVDTSISLSQVISDSTRIVFLSEKVTTTSGTVWAMDNIAVYGQQAVDHNFISLLFTDSCAYQDSLNVSLLYQNAGSSNLLNLSFELETGRSENEISQSQIFTYPNPILSNETVEIALGKFAYSTFIRTSKYDSTEIVIGNNEVGASVSNPISAEYIYSNDTVFVDLTLAETTGQEFQLAYLQKGPRTNQNLFSIGNIIDFNKNDSVITIPNLTYGLGYDLELKEKCGNTSNYSIKYDNVNNVPLQLKMACSDTLPLGYFEGFEVIIGGWGQHCFDQDQFSSERWDSETFIYTSYGPRNASKGVGFFTYYPSSSQDSIYAYSKYFNLTTNETPFVSFDFNMYSSNPQNVGTLILDIDSAGEWKTIWHKSGNQGLDWKSQIINLEKYTNQIVRFRLAGVRSFNSTYYNSRPAIDNFYIDSAATVAHYDMENVSPGSIISDLNFLLSSNASNFEIVPSKYSNNFAIDSITNQLIISNNAYFDFEKNETYNVDLAYLQNSIADTIGFSLITDDVDEPVFAGLGSAIRIETNDQFIFNGKIVPDGTPHTVAFWMKNKSQPFNPEIINFGNFKLDYSGRDLEFNGIGNIGEIADTGWVHIAQTFQTSRTILYINGAPIDTNAAFSSSYSNNYLGNTSGQNTGEGFRFDDLMLWGKPLKQTEIRNLMAGNFNSLDTNLVAYYDMNYSPNTSTLIDRTGNGFDLVAVGETYAKVQRSVDTIVVYVENTALANDSISRYFNFDPDSNNIAFASFVDTSGNFILDTTNNLVRLSPTADLSQISINSFALSYGIQESGDNQIGVVNYLVNVISLPNLPNQNLLIDENWPVGDTITTATVVNPDSNITYVYKIVGGNIDSSFGIDSLSGNLFVAKNDSIDAEYYSVFELSIEAKSFGDSSFTDTSLISINVNDLVEPIFVGFNNAVSLNGTNQYLESNNSVIPNSGNFSLSVWAKQNTIQTSAFNIVSQTSNFNTSNKRFYLGANNTGEIKIGDDWLNTGVQFPSDLKWHNYTFVKSPTEVVLYIDGDSVATKTINYANPDLPSFKIGVQFSGISEFFNGNVDELKVWNTNLNKDQVRQTIIDNPTELDSTLELYYNFDEVSNLVVDLSGNNKNATLLNYSNPTNAYLSSNDTLIVFAQELISDSSALFKTKAFDFDNSPIFFEILNQPDSLFTINDSTGEVYLLADTNLNFELSQNHTITIKATEQGDNQSGTVTYLIKVLDEPEPINTDLEIAFFGTFGKGYEYIPQAQKVKNLFSTIKNNGPDSVLNFYLILDDGISIDSIFVDTLLPNSSKEFSFSVSATGLTNGTYSYTNYIFTDTFDLNPSNDSLNIILTINDTLLAKSIVEDSTDTDIYLEFKPGVSSLQLNQKTATKLYLNQGDTLTNIALYLEGISVGDSILLELLTLKNNLPDSLLEQQIISFGDTTWGFKNFNLNCFNYLDSGTYALAIGKVNQNNSNIRFATSSSYFDSTSIFFTDTSGNWFQAQAASFASMPLINFSFKSTYNYPNLIVGGDTLLCAGDLQLLQAEVGIDTVLFGYSFKANAIYSGFAERYFAASYTDGNGCFFYDSVYVINQQLSPFIFDSIIGCADSLILRANPTWDAYNWFNGATDDTTKVIAPAEGFNKYFLSAETNEGCIAEDTLVALINPLPTVNLNNIGPFCNNEVDFIIDTSFYSPVGGAFSSGGPINGDTILVSQAFLGVLDSITYSFTDTNGCFNQTSTPLEIKVAPTASLNFVTVGLDSICANEVDTVLSGGLPNYGFYKGIGVINGNLFSTDSVVTTSSTITFIADSTNGCSDSAIASINLVTPPNIDSLKLTPLCLNDSIVALDGGFPVGGFYRGNGVSNDNFDPLVTSTGMQPITYVLQNNFGCFDSLSANIEVYGLPAAIFSGLPILCNNDTALNLAPFVNDTSNIYQFSGSGISGDYFNPFLISADTFDLIYQVTDSNFCSKKDTSAIVVLAPPTITLTTPSPICDYDTINLFNVLTPSPLGGNFKGSFVSDSLFKADTANTYNLRYVISDTSLSKTCSDSSLFNLTVNPAPIVNFNLPQNRVCVDQSNILLSGATPAGNSGIYTGTSINKISNQYFFYPPSADTGLHVITYTFTTSNGCVAEDKDTLRVDSLPSISISTIPSICAGDDTLNLNTFGFPLGGIFSGGAVFTDSVNYFFIPDSASIGVSNLVNYDYTDSITGCSNSSNSLITLNQIPALSFASLPSFCEDDTAFLISQYSPVGGIFLGNGITVDTINNQYYFHPDSVSVGIQTLTYQYTDNNGCTNSTQRSTNVNALPAVNLSLQGTPIDTLCLITTPQSFPLTFATPIGGQYSGKNVSFNTYNLNISSAGTDTVYYTYTNPTTGCVASDTSTLELINLPQVNFNLITDSICNNASVISIAGGTSTSAISQSFYSGPGVSNGNFNPNSLTPGIYNINFVVIDSVGCSDSASQNITVHPVPSISYNTIAPICLNDSTIINANTSGATFWKFSILNPSTNVLNQTTGLFHSNQTGIDSVQFMLVDANGCADSSVQTINVDTLPNVTLGNFNDVCRNGIPINLNTGTPIGGTYFYNGSAVTGSLSPNTLGAGSHKIIYRFTDLNSCTSIDSNNITVNLPPPITLSSLPKVCTDGSAITLNQGNPQGGIYSAAQGMLNDSVFDPTIVLAGSYNIQYSYTDANGCDSSLTGSLVVNPLPLVNFKNLIPSLCTNSDSIFIRDSVNFPALPPRGYFTGKGIDSTGWFNPYVAWIGGHNITYHYTDTNNCSNSTTTSIIVNGLPAPILSQNEVQICLGDTAILEAQGGIEFLWETGDTTAIIRVSPDSFKTYSVTVTDGLNCSNIGSIDQDVYNSFFVKANLDSVTTNLNTPLTVDLLANDNGNITKYKILDGPYYGTIDESFNPDLDYTPDPGFRRYDSLTYELCDDFCPIVCDTGMVKIQVFGNPNEFIPNGFSPNGDGTNDTWTVPGIELYPNNELIILNRWGSVVYQAAPYNNDWAGESGGNFSFGSDRLPDGTYFYILKLDKDSNTEGLTGSIEMRSKL